MQLKAKGVGQDDIAAALATIGEAWADSELVAACNHARRRRLGPWRTRGDRREQRQRDLASLARAGFSYPIAARIVDCEDAEALEQEARQGDEA